MSALVYEPINLPAFLQGHVSCEPASDAWVINRFTKEQLSYLSSTRERSIQRARCLAGVRCVFQGNITAIRCHLMDVSDIARSFAAIDLIRNGMIIGNDERSEVRWGDTLTLCIKPPEHEEDGVYELWLPTTVSAKVRIEICGSFRAVERPPKRYLSIGDSITQGMVTHGPAGTYAAVLGRMLNADFHNHGVGGHWFDPQLIGAVPGWEPDLVTVAYGTNDWTGGADGAELVKRAREVIHAARSAYPLARLILITPLWREDGSQLRDGNETPLESSQALFELRASEEIHVIDGVPLLPHHRRFTTDGLHPNDLGMPHVAQGLSRQIGEMSP